MAELRHLSGTMESCKSTLALQMDFTFAASGRRGWRFSRLDRAGQAISSRLGLSAPATDVAADLDLFEAVRTRLPLDYVICDETQFYAPVQIDQLGRVVDELGVDVYAFGLLTDSEGRLFPGAARLLEIADSRIELPVPALCWCGRRAVHNARIRDGVVDRGPAAVDTEASYRPLCRAHYRVGAAGPAAKGGLQA